MPWGLDPSNESVFRGISLLADALDVLRLATSGYIYPGAYHVRPVQKHRATPRQIETGAGHRKLVAAGTPHNALSLANRYAKPGVSYSDEEIRATLRQFRSQWEENLDERLAPGP